MLKTNKPTPKVVMMKFRMRSGKSSEFRKNVATTTRASSLGWRGCHGFVLKMSAFCRSDIHDVKVSTLRGSELSAKVPAQPLKFCWKKPSLAALFENICILRTQQLLHSHIIHIFVALSTLAQYNEVDFVVSRLVCRICAAVSNFCLCFANVIAPSPKNNTTIIAFCC